MRFWPITTGLGAADFTTDISAWRTYTFAIAGASSVTGSVVSILSVSMFEFARFG